MYVIAKVHSDPHDMIDPIRAKIHSIDPNLPLGDTELMSDHIATAVTEPRHWTLLVGSFAAIAVTLAALGVFGVMSYIVAQQQREIGVRLALGAAPSAVLGLVLKRGLVLACIGTVIGIGISTQGTRVLQHVLFNVSPSDPRTLAAVAVMLVGIAAVACYFPGRRAARVDPVRVIAGD
jgi:putative ABC transport system permease protein